MAWTEHQFPVPPEGVRTVYEWHCPELRYTLHCRMGTWFVLCSQLGIGQIIPDIITDPDEAKLLSLRMVRSKVKFILDEITKDGKALVEAQEKG